MIVAKKAPSREDLLAARGRTVPDLAGVGMRAVFCGINPSLYSAAVGAHFARPGNRFWPALARAGITDRVLGPQEQRELLARGYGITNLVDRATASADELGAEELAEGARKLARKVRRWKPQVVAVLGVSAYRVGFGRSKVGLGRQEDTIGGAIAWVLPNPSGLNAHYQVDDLARFLRELHELVTRSEE